MVKEVVGADGKVHASNGHVYTVTEGAGNVFLNTIEQEYIAELTVTKIWNAPEGIVLPESVTVYLYGDENWVAMEGVTNPGHAHGR